MEHTSCEHKCPWVKSGFCTAVEECPNFVETWWKLGESGESKLVRDCVPKRLMIQMAQLQLRIENAQAASEGAKRETHLLKEQFCELVRESQRCAQLNEGSVTVLKIENKESL